jgi:hypothetical protein
MTDNHHRWESAPEPAPSEKKERDRDRSESGTDGQSSFEETKKEFFNLLWSWVPKRLRVPLVALIVIGATLLSTQSFWYPPLNSWLHKPIPGGQLMRKVDLCAAPPLEGARTIYLFDFASDMAAPQKLNEFQRLLIFKLQTGIRPELEGARLLANSTLEIKPCREAPVRDQSDALSVGMRLGCAGIISGYIEEENHELKSYVHFTAIGASLKKIDTSIEDIALVSVGPNFDSLSQVNARVHKAYLAFSSFILGTLYLKDSQLDLARRCFQYTIDIDSGSGMAKKADRILQSLQPANPANTLAPIGGPES